jgi:hypothetical protein
VQRGDVDLDGPGLALGVGERFHGNSISLGK